jgi:hypothetical protein
MLGLWLLAISLIALLVAFVATSPPPDRDRRRRNGRAAVPPHRDPDLITYSDVETLLLLGPTPPDVVSRVMVAAQDQRVTARTLWRWAAVHGHARLVSVVEARVAEDALLDHLDRGTAPHWAALTTRTPPPARPAAQPVRRPAGTRHSVRPVTAPGHGVAALDSLELLGFDRLPPIAGPGLGHLPRVARPGS